MDLRIIWNVLRRWWWLLAFGAIIGIGIGLTISRETTPVYRATARLLISAKSIPGLDSSQSGTTSERLSTYSELLRSRPLLDRTIQQLGLQMTPEELRDRVSIKPIRDTQILELLVTHPDPLTAAAIANRLAEVFIAQNRSLEVGSAQDAKNQVGQELIATRLQIDDITRRLSALPVPTSPAGGAGATGLSGEATRLQGELSRYQGLYFQLLETQQRMALAQAQATSSIAVIEPALPPAAPVGPHTAQNMLLGAFLGLLLTGTLGLLINFLDDRVRDPEEVRHRFGLTPLASLSFTAGPAGHAPLLSDPTIAQDDYFAEDVRRLRANLTFVVADSPYVVIMSSANENEGKSTVAANLAVAMAQAGQRVVLIDADLRKPTQHRLFGLDNQQGLSTFLTAAHGERPPWLQTGPDGLSVLTSGPLPPNPSELLSSRRMAILISYLRGQADMIILDSVPLLAVADVLVLQRYADGTILVMDTRRTGMRTLERSMLSLQQASANVLGVVLNKDKTRRPRYYSGHPQRSQGRVPGGDAHEAAEPEKLPVAVEQAPSPPAPGR